MYNDIGKKIKGLASILFAAGAVCALVLGLTCCLRDEDYVIIGVLVIVVGFLISWVSSWFMYGFGEIIDKLCEISQNTRGGAPTAAAPVREVVVTTVPAREEVVTVAPVREKTATAAPAEESPIIISRGLRPPKAF